MSDDDFEAALADAFETEAGATADEATAAAGRAAAFREDWAEDLTAAAVLDAVEAAADSYDAFTHRFNDAIGTLADETEDCTDSRAYRLSGFGDLAADPEQSA
ncbi:hypothetical protein [Halorientalis litorea]|jgi:hypothetical protein|uniref:hypothetical protein n=1 Tax=Halorientalis litorea TaxID=2931977 RepID=UPI001FF0EEF8|nr:hypothetical protein [Halorientalis litorea]